MVARNMPIDRAAKKQSIERRADDLAATFHVPMNFVPNIRMYLATIGADQLVCVEKEAGEKGLHSHSATKSSPLRIVRLTDVMQRLNT